LLLFWKHGLIENLEWNSNDDLSVYDDHIYVGTREAVGIGQQQEATICAQGQGRCLAPFSVKRVSLSKAKGIRLFDDYDFIWLVTLSGAKDISLFNDREIRFD